MFVFTWIDSKRLVAGVHTYCFGETQRWSGCFTAVGSIALQLSMNEVEEGFPLGFFKLVYGGLGTSTSAWMTFLNQNIRKYPTPSHDFIGLKKYFDDAVKRCFERITAELDNLRVLLLF